LSMCFIGILISLFVDAVALGSRPAAASSISIQLGRQARGFGGPRARRGY
jgi:hypothetical protein